MRACVCGGGGVRERPGCRTQLPRRPRPCPAPLARTCWASTGAPCHPGRQRPAGCRRGKSPRRSLRQCGPAAAARGTGAQRTTASRMSPRSPRPAGGHWRRPRPRTAQHFCASGSAQGWGPRAAWRRGGGTGRKGQRKRKGKKSARPAAGAAAPLPLFLVCTRVQPHARQTSHRAAGQTHQQQRRAGSGSSSAEAQSSPPPPPPDNFCTSPHEGDPPPGASFRDPGPGAQ